MRWALLFVILVSVAGGCQSYRDRKAIHAFLAETSPQLTPQRAALGEVEAEGNELTLLDGALTLAFRVPHGEDDVGRSFHLHALATPRGRATGGLDLCLVGADLSEAVDGLVKSALPPVVSAVRDEPLLGAQHMWNDTVHGIDGQSAYLGDYRVRGDAGDPLISHFIDDGVFAGMPQLPHDGRMHLVKVVALAKNGELRRTVELDGAAQIEDGKLVGGRSAGSGSSTARGASGLAPRSRCVPGEAPPTILRTTGVGPGRCSRRTTASRVPRLRSGQWRTLLFRGAGAPRRVKR